MQENMVNKILLQYASELQKIYDTHLKSIILYGSYARGDFTPNSDIDIMVLVDLPDIEIKDYSEELSQLTYDINLDNDLLLMPIVKNIDHFQYWVEAYPFYNIIKNEGIPLYVI